MGNLEKLSSITILGMNLQDQYVDISPNNILDMF